MSALFYAPRTTDVRPIARHSFSREIAEELAGLRDLDNWHGLVALATDWAVIVAVAAATQLIPGPGRWVFYVLAALPVIGTRQRALATLLHEATHGTLARSRRLNNALGTFPAAHLILQTQIAYRRSHLRQHHGFFGNPELDPDLRAHIAAGVYRGQSGRSFALRFLISPLFGLRTPLLLKELVVQRLSGSRRETAAGLGVAAYLAAIGGVFALCGRLDLFLLYWLIPLLTAFPLVNWYIELLEHFPLVGNEDVDILTTRPRAVGPISRHFLGIHHEGYHLDHHLSPKIPYWNLPRAHEIRLRDTRFRAAVHRTAPAGRGVLWQFTDMVRRVDGGQSTARLGSRAGAVLPRPGGRPSDGTTNTAGLDTKVPADHV